MPDPVGVGVVPSNSKCRSVCTSWLNHSAKVRSARSHTAQPTPAEHQEQCSLACDGLKSFVRGGSEAVYLKMKCA